MMVITLLSLVPIMFLIAMGFVLRVKNLIDASFWLPCEKLNYYYLFPALMFSLVGKAQLSEFPVRRDCVLDSGGGVCRGIGTVVVADMVEAIRADILVGNAGRIAP